MRRLGLTLPHSMSEVGEREAKGPEEHGSRPVTKSNSQGKDDDDARNGNYEGRLVLRQGIIPYQIGSGGSVLHM